jgi:hypothetical protein
MQQLAQAAADQHRTRLQRYQLHVVNLKQYQIRRSSSSRAAMGGPGQGGDPPQNLPSPSFSSSSSNIMLFLSFRSYSSSHMRM